MIYPFYLDWTFLLIIPGIIVAAWAQSKVNKAYQTYAKNICGKRTDRPGSCTAHSGEQRDSRRGNHGDKGNAFG